VIFLGIVFFIAPPSPLQIFLLTLLLLVEVLNDINACYSDETVTLCSILTLVKPKNSKLMFTAFVLDVNIKRDRSYFAERLYLSDKQAASKSTA